MKKILMTILCAMFFTFGMVFSANASFITDDGGVYIDGKNYVTNKDALPDPVEPYMYYIGDEDLWWYGYQEGVGNPDSDKYDKHSAPAVAHITGNAEELYKSEFNFTTGEDFGAAANWYETTFEGDPNNATIAWRGDDFRFISGATHLLLKDGSHDPVWYLFNIYGWDGKTSIVLENFWLNGGAISHVALYGGTPVPEPGMVILLGIGLIGLAFYSRKRLFNQ